MHGAEDGDAETMPAYRPEPIARHPKGSALTSGSALPPLEVAAIALVRERRVLMVTARGRDVYYMPGGKVDAGETPAEAAAREAFEEVRLPLEASDLTELFVVETQAHGEPDGRLVRMVVFGTDTLDEPHPSNEVSALHWCDTRDDASCPPAGREVLRLLAAAGMID